ncbi:MAG: division/cell wall cluster transcriptional repressor MraZ [Hyphomicrobiales bacterium]|nr:division/cell wall cluster transcriptional repressor MraZ [Hyphomicrobiales bacterium]
MADENRFVSSFTNRLDAKGRVSIPAPFRTALARDGFEGLFVHPSLDGHAIDCGGHALLKEIDTLLETYPPYTEERDTLSLALLGMSERLKVDPEGRVQLSESCKARAGVSSEVTFVGLGHKFQIWEPERFRAHQEEARNRARDLRKISGARGAAGHTPPAHGARE